MSGDIKTGRRETISVCMIVRDEEENLPRCLASLKDLADEIIVVDTGSKDRTVEIAQSFGAKVYNHPWQDDFSLHRNQSIDYSTGDWILIADADDEFFMPRGQDALRNLLMDRISDEYVASALLLKDIQAGRCVMQYNQPRLFRKGNIRFRGIVHNQMITKEPAVFIPQEYLYLHHYGYDLTPEKFAAKSERSLRLLMKRLEMDPEDYPVHFYLTQIYFNQFRYEECCREGEEYLKCKEKLEDPKGKWQHFNGSVYYTILHSYMKMGDVENTKRWLDLASRNLKDDLDTHLSTVEFGVWTDNESMIVDGAKKFVRLYDKFQKTGVLDGNRFLYSNNPEAKAYCEYHLVTNQLRNGIRNIPSFMRTLQNCSPVFAERIRVDFNEELRSLKMGDILSKYGDTGTQQKHKGILDELREKKPGLFGGANGT